VANDIFRSAVLAPKYLPERRSTALTHHYTPGARNSQAQCLNLRRGQSLVGKTTVDINDEQTDGFLDEI